MAPFLWSCWFHLKDSLRFNPGFGMVASLALEFSAWRKRSDGGNQLGDLCRSARACPSARRRLRLEGLVRSQAERIDVHDIAWEALSYGDTKKHKVSKAIILKSPVSEKEKGILYVTFEGQWIKLLRSGRAEEIAQVYDLVLGPTWSPPHDAALLMAARIWPERLFTLLSNLADASTIRSLSPGLVPVPLLASSWTNPDLYAPYLHLEKTIDILMIASFSQYKRHWLLFETLRKLPRSLRIVLIGRPVEIKITELQRQARLFGVEDRFELWNNATDDQIAKAICQSRIGLIFSRQEGSCLAVAESMMGGSPVGMFENARIGSKAFINPRTGVLLAQRKLARQVLGFLDRHDRFEPRPWAVENISCRVSNRILNEVLRAEAERSGRPWTRDIALMYQNSVPVFVDASEARMMEPWYDDFHDRFGVELAFPQRQAFEIVPK
jgi:glycosyltransferase involved in cell wall biosynthesis